MPDEWQKRIDEDKCPVCGLEKQKWTRRVDWCCCSRDCTKAYAKEVIYGWPQMRELVLKRDDYKCVKCGGQPTREVFHYVGWNQIKVSERKLNATDRAYTIIDKSNLVADHIEPIALGGHQWDINNIQTLCRKCDKIKTKIDQGNIAKLRAKEKALKHNNKLSTYNNND